VYGPGSDGSEVTSKIMKVGIPKVNGKILRYCLVMKHVSAAQQRFPVLQFSDVNSCEQYQNGLMR
jgi:hypothetical protein